MLRVRKTFALAAGLAVFGAATGSAYGLDYKALDRKDRKAVRKTLRCAEEITERGSAGIAVSLHLVQQLSKPELRGRLDGLATICRIYLDALEPATLDTEEKLETLATLAGATGAAHGAVELVAALINPVVTCRGGGIHASVAAIFGASASLAGSHCKTNTGKRWFEASPGAGFATGIGVTASAFVIPRSEEAGSDPGFASLDGNYSIDGALGLAVHAGVELEDGADLAGGAGAVSFQRINECLEASEANFENGKEVFACPVRLGVGVGIGGVIGIEPRYDIKILPLPRNWKSVTSNL